MSSTSRAKHTQDQVGPEKFAVLGLLCDLQSQLAGINWEFHTSGGDVTGMTALVADMRRTVGQLADACSMPRRGRAADHEDHGLLQAESEED